MLPSIHGLRPSSQPVFFFCHNLEFGKIIPRILAWFYPQKTGVTEAWLQTWSELAASKSKAVSGQMYTLHLLWLALSCLHHRSLHELCIL